jgi:hypothetical protein
MTGGVGKAILKCPRLWDENVPESELDYGDIMGKM